ncbi:MAG TPA: hypothetical protein G4N94_06425 [Caldilineae bacterium]|nr:hypothetical protein [Caldilineae bacterium]
MASERTIKYTYSLPPHTYWNRPYVFTRPAFFARDLAVGLDDAIFRLIENDTLLEKALTTHESCDVCKKVIRCHQTC